MRARRDRRATRRRARVLVLLLSGLGAWATLGEVDVVATAEGRLIPIQRVQRIQPVEAGRVVAIHVDDGTRVRAGDVLVEIDDALHRADRDRLANSWAANRAELARLRALADAPAHRYEPSPTVDAAQRARHRTLLDAELAEHDAALAGIDAQMRREAARAEATAAAIARHAAILPLAEERSEARRRLAESGHGPRLAWLDSEQQRLERLHEIRELEARRREIDAVRAMLAEQRRAAELALRRRAEARLVEVERLDVSLAQELAKAERHLGYQRLTAPIDGTVLQLAVHTLGGVVAAGETLMQIVPDDARLEVEALVPNRDAGFVTPDQPAQIKLEAFPFAIYGTLDGHVRDVGRDAIDDARVGPSFPVRIALARQHIRTGERAIPLSPGLRVTVDVVTERRSVAAALAAPLLRLRHDALRER
ncbi:MAG: HlyD family type I secretion periplasmic adaptor subunit [Alphaproteobacteria bacterium]|nr:HlyD family type I secretion periplasmic adaptor subunit [Alphaproteobacteria bacterium]